MLRAPLHWLTDEPHHRLGLRAFQALLGVAMAFRVATEFRFAGWLYGPNGIGTGSSTLMLRDWHGAVDWVYQFQATPFLLVLVEGVAVALFIWGRHTRIAAALASARPSSRSTPASAAPAAASEAQMPSPSPPPAPVTSATRPSSANGPPLTDLPRP